MYSVIIVDDEALSRYALHVMLSKNMPDLNVAAECEDGASAVQAALRYKPDIVIIDIKMPGMNGLTASKTILENLPGTTILILTAYDSFEYAREALTIGVKGYLLKPLIEKEVTETLQKITDSLSQNRAIKDKDVEEKEIVSLAIPVIKRNLVASYINGTAAPALLAEYSPLLPGLTDSGFFMLFPLTPSPDSTLPFSLQPPADTYKQITESISQMINFHKNVQIGEVSFHVLPLFFHISPSDPSWHETACMLARKIITLLNQRFKLKSGAAFGGVYHTCQLFKSSYQEALEVLPALLPGTVIEYTPVSNSTHTVYPYSLEEQFMDSLRSRNTERAHGYAQQLLNEIFTARNSLQISKEYSIQFLSALKSLLHQLGFRQTSFDLYPFLCQIQSSVSEHQLKEYVNYALHSFLEFLQNESQEKTMHLMKKINYYIEREPIQMVSLEGLSSYLNLTPQYVSKVFKEEYHLNFTDYITQKKISLAKPLLEKGMLSVQDVSIQVGYSDQNYFCRIFKKITGLTPKEYQKYAKTL